MTSDDRYCCVKCFSQLEIQNFIEEAEIVDNCEFCGSKRVHIREAKEVGNFIEEGLLKHYEDAAISVGYESAEGGYGLSTQTISEILQEEDIWNYDLSDPTDLIEALIDDNGTPYVRQDPYGPLSGQPEEIESWNDFCLQVKNERRFTLFLSSKQDSHWQKSPSEFLDYIAKFIQSRRLVDLIPTTTIYRARIEEQGKQFGHIDLTSPRPEYSRNNRMSPAGIPFFYGAFKPETCIAEVRPNIGDIVTVGKFEVISPIKLLDLGTKEEEPLSIYSDEYSFTDEEYYKPFLRHFISDISRPIHPNDEATGYVPTQIFTEFIKMYVFKEDFYTDDKMEEDPFMVNGFTFKSSLMDDGTNIVLFKGPDISTENPEKSPNAWLKYTGFDRYKIDSIKVQSQKIIDFELPA